MKVTHRPSGSMCFHCRFAYLPQYCPNEEEFKTMTPIKTDKDGVIVVKCKEFKRG
ncbi:MAG: hypothetical protein ACK5NC_05225 [Vibrio sp.]